MAKKAPSGLGIWVAFENMITPGPGVDKTIALAKKIGAKWIAVRGGGTLSGGHNLRDPGLPVGAIKAYKDAGLDVYVWVFSYPYETARKDEIELYKKFVAEGADGLIVNAEVAWKIKDCDAKAAQHVAEIREAVGDTWVAHAPFALPISHRDFPYDGFGGLDACLAQLYWTEFAGIGSKPWIDKYEREWKQFREDPKHAEAAKQPVYPIGVTYGSELGKKWGLKQVPPGAFNVSDLETFLDHFKDCPMPSLYTLEAMCDDCRDYLIAHAKLREEEEAKKAPEHRDEPAVEVPVKPETVVIPKPAPKLQPTQVSGQIVVPQPTGFLAMIFQFLMRLLSLFAKK